MPPLPPSFSFLYPPSLPPSLPPSPYTSPRAMIPPVDVPTIQSNSSGILRWVSSSMCLRISSWTSPRMPPPSRHSTLSPAGRARRAMYIHVHAGWDGHTRVCSVIETRQSKATMPKGNSSFSEEKKKSCLKQDSNP